VHGVGWGSPSPIERRACSSLPSCTLVWLVSSHHTQTSSVDLVSPCLQVRWGFFFSFFCVLPRFLLSSWVAGN
jgi:hypothetical protein